MRRISSLKIKETNILSRRETLSLCGSTVKAKVVLGFFYQHNAIFEFLVRSGEPFGVGRVLIPPVIAKNREFGANLVGKYYPRIVPFGPFGFYENLYFTK